MSFRPERLNQYSGKTILEFIGSPDLKEEVNLHELFLDILNDKIHGICFSAYFAGQKPGSVLQREALESRVVHLKPFTQWIRSFSCTEGNEHIPELAHKHGIKTLVGAWLGNDKDKNEEEIEGLIRLAKNGFVDVASVGNEVLYRNDLSLDELMDYLSRVKNAIPDVPIGYVDAYYEFLDRPELVEMSDVLLINCYPFWEGTPFRYALGHMDSMYESVKQIAGNKPVIVTETGWPSQGAPTGGAHPSVENALRYFINAQLWAAEKQVPLFYFSSFDEDWKTGPEGDVGAFWGLWDRYGQLKY